MKHSWETHSMHRGPRAMLRLAGLVVALILVAAACSSDDDAGGSGTGDDGPGGELTVYSGRSENLIGPLIERFETETGIDVAVRYAGSTELALLIREEGDRSPADVFLSQSPGAVAFLEQEGLLANLPQTILSNVDEQFRSPEAKWVGVSGRQRVLIYNPELISEADLPTSVFDLVDPAFEGKIGVAPANGSFQDFVTAMRAEVGDEKTSEWLEGLDANNPRIYADNSSIVAAVGRGEVATGLVNHYYGLRALAEDPSFEGVNHRFAADDIGSLVIVTGAAALENRDNPDLAEQFIAFLLSTEAQEFFSGETLEYPLAAGVDPPENVPPFEGGAAGFIDFASLGGGLESTVSLIEESGLGEG